MALNLTQKKEIVSKMNKIANIALSAIIANPTGITVNQINELRKTSRENKIKINIVKNTLLKMSIQKTPLECLTNKIIGSTLIAYSIKHPGSAAKLFKNFSKKNKSFKITTAVLNGKILSELEIDKLANLPTYKDAIIRFVITLITATIGKLFFVLLAIKQKKENI